MPKISSSFRTNLTDGLRKFENDVKSDAREIAHDLKSGGAWTAKGRTDLVKDLKNTVSTFGGETVGVAELAGLRYPVSAYEFKVSDGLTRGSRINDTQGYNKLVAQGFKGIVDLTLEGTNDATLGKQAGLNTCNVKILDNSAPTMAQMKQFLDFATNPANSPCYVHCEAGKGRTGVATACYRMAVEGWPADKAIAEGKKFGLALPDQIEFLQQFAAALAKGQIAGYPKA